VAMSLDNSIEELPMMMISSTYTNKYSVTLDFWYMNRDAYAFELTKPR